MTVIILIHVMLLVNAEKAWALSVIPTSPIADQPFTIDSGSVISESINVYDGWGCSGGIIASGIVPAGGVLTVQGQPAGQYSTNANFEVGCLNFTIIPPPLTG